MGITHPIKFEDLNILNEVYSTFLEDIKTICQKHNVPQYVNTVNVCKDDKKCELYILKMGAYGKGTDDEKAFKEIISTFENIFK